MNPEQLFEKLIKNKISREEFEDLLDGFEDEDILARYEVYLQSQFDCTTTVANATPETIKICNFVKFCLNGDSGKSRFTVSTVAMRYTQLTIET